VSSERDLWVAWRDTVSLRQAPGRTPHQSDVTVTDARGRKMLTRLEQEVLASGSKFGVRYGGSSRTVELAPRRVAVMEYALTSTFDLSSPGEYRIAISQLVVKPDLEMFIVTGELAFTVRPRAGAP